MRRTILVALAACTLGTVALAQGTTDAPPRVQGGRRWGGPAGRNYDPATVTTVNGTVEAVERGPGGGGQGVHVRLKTADGTTEVHLGPAWYLEEQKLSVAKGDTLEVTGSKRQVNQASFLIARSVKKGGAEFTLRDESGVPRWAGARRR